MTFVSDIGDAIFVSEDHCWLSLCAVVEPMMHHGIYIANDDGLSGALKPISPFVNPLLTDMHQITMAYSLWKNKHHEIPSAFDLFFRKNPFGGEFTVFAGLEEVIKFLSAFKFKDEHVKFVKSLLPDADEGFLEWLSYVDCSRVTVRAIKEGSVVFPRVPLLTVEGPLGVCQLLETTLLTLVNFASLVATNAARHKLAAGGNKAILEFGLRSAQGPDGGLSASRYSYVGGCDGTSNTLANKLFGIPVCGMHPRSHITSFADVGDFTERIIKRTDGKEVDLWELVQATRKELGYTHTNTSELLAFSAYACAFPKGFSVLVDTYDTLNSGIPNFLVVAVTLHRIGYKAAGIFIENGDLADLSTKARSVFKEVGKTYKIDYFEKLSIVVGNTDLNETTINSLYRQGHEIDTFVVGANVATGHTQPDWVYELVEINGTSGVRLSQQNSNASLPGRKAVYRLYGAAGHALVDIMIPYTTPYAERPKEGEKVLCLHPFEDKRVYVVPTRVVPMHSTVWDGEVSAPIPKQSEVRDFCTASLTSMRVDHLRTFNSTPYKVSVSKPLWDKIQDYILQAAHSSEDLELAPKPVSRKKERKYIHADRITTESAEFIVSELIADPPLLNLELYNASFESGCVQLIARALSFNETLVNVILPDSSLSGEEVQIFAEMLKINKRIKKLVLSGTNIGDTGAQYLAQALHVNNTLSDLNLSNNSIGNRGAQAIAAALHTNHTLLQLSLADNSITDAGVGTILEALKVNKVLATLDIAGRDLGYICAIALIAALKVNSTLTFIGYSTQHKNLAIQIDWYLMGNNVCKDLRISIKYRNQIPIEMKTEEEMRRLLARLKLEKLQNRPKLHKKVAKNLSEWLQQKEATIKQDIAKDLLEKAFSLSNQSKPVEARCYLSMIDRVMPIFDATIWNALQVQERKNQIEKTIGQGNDEHAVETQTNLQEEKEAIEIQRKGIQAQEERLKEKMEEYEVKNKTMHDREAQVGQLLKQVQQLEQLLTESMQISNPNQQSAVDNDFGAIKLRFESIQNSAKAMQRRMEQYKKRGMSPEQMTYRNFLEDVKNLQDNLKNIPRPLQCFISYAWEEDTAVNDDLQRRLLRLQGDLQAAGITVWLDIRDMEDDMKACMEHNILQSHKYILICTPRLKVRAADPVENNIQRELKTALAKKTPDFIIPLVFGDFADSVPPQVKHIRALPFKGTTDKEYYTAMSSVTHRGLIPALLKLHNNNNYDRIQRRLAQELEDFEKANL